MILSIMDNLHMIYTHEHSSQVFNFSDWFCTGFCIWAFHDTAKKKSEPTHSPEVVVYYKSSMLDIQMFCFFCYGFFFVNI